MPKKRQQLKSIKPPSSSSTSATAAGGAADSDRPGVNELLANLRRTALGSSSARHLPANTPSVPPNIRAILQIPETPPPPPRRPLRPRFDGLGRRLPAGPPPPRSWLLQGDDDEPVDGASGQVKISQDVDKSALPGTHLPGKGSLVDIVLRSMARQWSLHRAYNFHYLYYLPCHLKPALIRYIGYAGDDGISVADLRLLLHPPEAGAEDDDELQNEQLNHLDLSGSLGRSIRLKEISNLLFPAPDESSVAHVDESWDQTCALAATPGPLVPHLTHLSLALRPGQTDGASWKQLLALSSKLGTLTHLSLAYWPDPCLTPRARNSTVSTPQGRSIPYGGTSPYAHTLDDDWNEALLVLRTLSRNLYALEFLDLTGCATWFKALALASGHDFVDWVGSWGKVTDLRLNFGWEVDGGALPSLRMAHEKALQDAKLVEQHIIATRAGQGRIVNVARN